MPKTHASNKNDSSSRREDLAGQKLTPSLFNVLVTRHERVAAGVVAHSVKTIVTTGAVGHADCKRHETHLENQNFTPLLNFINWPFPASPCDAGQPRGFKTMPHVAGRSVVQLLLACSRTPCVAAPGRSPASLW